MSETGVIPAEVIASFDLDGKIYPVYFRVTNKDKSRDTLKITRILQRKDSYYAGFPVQHFICETVVEGTKKSYHLRYVIDRHIWQIEL